MSIEVAENIFQKASNMLSASKSDLVVAKKKKGFSPLSEHDIVLKYVNEFLSNIQFIYELNGTNFNQDR